MQSVFFLTLCIWCGHLGAPWRTQWWRRGRGGFRWERGACPPAHSAIGPETNCPIRGQYWGHVITSRPIRDKYYLRLVHFRGGQPPSDHVNHLVHAYIVLFVFSHYNFFPHWQWHKTRRREGMNQNGSRPQLISLCGKSFIEDIQDNAFCIFRDCIMYCEEFLLLGSRRKGKCSIIIITLSEWCVKWFPISCWIME